MAFPHGRAAINAFYGKPYKADGSLDEDWEAANIVSLSLPYAMFYEGTTVHSVRVHRKCKDSLLDALTAIYRHARVMVKDRDGYDKDTEYYNEETRKLLTDVGLDQFGGIYNFRKIRGASGYSLHAYGAAIDIDPEHNVLGATHGRMPRWAVDIFVEHGWTWGGAFANRKDWQHFQAASGA